MTGQLHLLALPQVVENLREACGKKAEDLYRFIYWDSWQRLPDDARDVLTRRLSSPGMAPIWQPSAG